MILVLGGTREGREVVSWLKARGYPVLATAVTSYGAELLDAAGADLVSTGALDADGMVRLLRERGVKAVVDATHPFAVNATAHAGAACKHTGVPYVRFERPEEALPQHPLVSMVDSFATAARLAVSLGPVVFLTTGSSKLQIFLDEARPRGVRVVARVLPNPDVLRTCYTCGLRPADIVAMSGPGSLELNITLLKEYGAAVLVTKDSGPTGGTGIKVAAATALGIPAVVVRRPVWHHARLQVRSCEELAGLLPSPG